MRDWLFNRTLVVIITKCRIERGDLHKLPSAPQIVTLTLNTEVKSLVVSALKINSVFTAYSFNQCARLYCC